MIIRRIHKRSQGIEAKEESKYERQRAWYEADEEGRRTRELWPVFVPRDKHAGIKTWKTRNTA